jgi:hypothetical protein
LRSSVLCEVARTFVEFGVELVEYEAVCLKLRVFLTEECSFVAARHVSQELHHTALAAPQRVVPRNDGVVTVAGSTQTAVVGIAHELLVHLADELNWQCGGFTADAVCQCLKRADAASFVDKVPLCPAANL